MLPIWRPFKSLMLSIIGVLIICLLFKYVFLSNCLSINGTRACVTSVVTDTTILLTIGSLLIALFVMIPTFWIESKIRDAQKEVEEELRDKIHSDMQKIHEAQILLVHVSELYKSGFSFDEAMPDVEEAIRIWPAFRQKEFMRLGIEMGKAVIYGSYPVESPAGIIPTILTQVDMIWLQREGLNYLKATVFTDDAPDKEVQLYKQGLLYLACLFGYRKEYDEMIRVIDRAVQYNLELKEDFREAHKFAALLKACGSDSNKLVRLGRKLELDMPVTRNSFCNFIRDVDLVALRGSTNQYISWLVVKRPRTPDEGEVFMANIYVQEVAGVRKVNANYHIRGGSSNTQTIADSANPIPVEELFNQLNDLFFFIHSEE